jgi:hypothetical protein
MNDSDDDLAPDIVEYVHHNFSSDIASSTIDRLTVISRSNRIRRCIAFESRGHPWYFDYLCKLLSVDYRDVIFAAEYMDSQTRLYDFTMPIDKARIDAPFG